MTPPAVVDHIALSKVRYYLAGLKGYNTMIEAEKLLMRAVQSVCVSVEHLDATLSRFEEQCPTPREIKDVGLNLRDRYLPPKPSQEEEWRKQYGPPNPAWSESLLATAAANLSPLEKKERHKTQRHEMRLHALQDSVYFATPAGQDDLNAIVGKDDRNGSKRFWADAIAKWEKEQPAQVAAVRACRHCKGSGRIGKEYCDQCRPQFDDAPPAPKVLPMRRPITAESFKGVEPMHVERCHNCGGSGRLAGDDYCNECQTGRNLRKIETSYSTGTENPPK